MAVSARKARVGPPRLSEINTCKVSRKAHWDQEGDVCSRREHSNPGCGLWIPPHCWGGPGEGAAPEDLAGDTAVRVWGLF